MNETEAVTLMIRDNPVPLKIDKDGVVRVGGTRVTLDIVVDAFLEGATAEEIVMRYPVLHLTDVYSVIAYYLHHSAEVDACIEMERGLEHQARQEVETQSDITYIRERLLARQNAQGS